METHKSHCFLLRNSGSWLARNQVEKNETFVPCGVRGVEVKSSQPDYETGLFFFKLVVVAIRVFIAFVVVVFVDKDAFFACH